MTRDGWGGPRDHRQLSLSRRSLVPAEERHQAEHWHCQGFPGRADIEGQEEERLLQHSTEEPRLPHGEDLLGHTQPVPKGGGQWEHGHWYQPVSPASPVVQQVPGVGMHQALGDGRLSDVVQLFL